MNSISPWRLFVASKIMTLLPETRFFAFKSRTLRWAGVKVGSNVRVCSSTTILGDGFLRIGNNVWIGSQTMIVASASVSLGSNIDIAPRVFIGTGTHEFDEEGFRAAGAGVSHPIVIEDGVWIGAGATILAGVSIGANSMVAAGAVVNKDVFSRSLVGGVPAKLIRRLGAASKTVE